MKITGTKHIPSGEYLSYTALEIQSIPDITITNSTDEQEVQSDNALRLAQVMGSIFDVYKSQATHSSCDLAIEFMWLSVPVTNQTYAARIRLIILFRSIATDRATSESITMRAANAYAGILELEKYSIVELANDEFNEALESANFDVKQSVMREVHVESLPLPAMPKCAYFDNFDVEPPALELIINALIKSPQSLIAFQLLPTQYTHAEREFVSTTAQTLSMLSSGLHDPAFGVIPVVAAQKCTTTYEYYHTNDNRPLFVSNIVVMSSQQYSSNVVASVRAMLGGKKQVATKVIPLEQFSTQSIKQNYISLPWHISDYLLNHTRSFGTTFARLPFIVTAEEAVALFSTPVGGNKINAGFSIEYASRQGKEYRSQLIDSDNIKVGKLKSSTESHYIGFSKDDLTKHMLIVGTPGSGKTTFSVGLLDRLWKQGIPFLVIEPAKNEYRALIKSIPDIQVFTPGKNSISPFVFNPFLPPENVRLEAYKSVLKTAFEAGVSMTSPLDRIFEDTISNCYSDFGWLDTYTAKDKGRIFNIADFIQCFQQTVEDIGYVGEASNIAKAGVVRLKGLSGLFDTYNSIPIGDLLSKPTIIELAAVENEDEKALIIALLLLSIMTYINANYSGNSGLRNVILIEEAHVLLDSQSHGGDGDANPCAVAQRLVKRMLAEIRSYGVGLIIADQSPRKVSTDVVALTDIKLAFRLVESEDKRILSESINMTDVQTSRLARLRPGEAFFFFNKLDEPEEIITDNYRIDNKIEITLSDDEIARRTTYWKQHANMLKPYPECKYCRHCVATCLHERRMLAKQIARRIFMRYFKTSCDGKVPRQAVGQVSLLLKAISEGRELEQKERTFAAVLYSKHFRATGGRTTLEDVFKSISRIAQEEANGEPITPELLICIKLHLFRRIEYETHIRVTPSEVKNSLSK